MSFNTSYIVNQDLKVDDQKLSRKIDELLVLQEQIALANGFDIVDSYPATQVYKNISGLKFLYPMQERIGTVARDSSENKSNGTYAGVVLGGSSLSDNVPRSALFSNNGYMQAGLSGSVKGLSSYTFTCLVNLTSSYASQHLWHEATNTDVTKARLQIMWNSNGTKKLLVAVRSGTASQAFQLAETTNTIPDGIAVIHVVVNIGKNKIKIYRTGVELATTGIIDFGGATIVEDTNPVTHPFFGRISNAPSQFFQSNASYVALYDRELTNKKITNQCKAVGFS